MVADYMFVYMIGFVREVSKTPAAVESLSEE